MERGRRRKEKRKEGTLGGGWRRKWYQKYEIGKMREEIKERVIFNFKKNKIK